VVTQRLERTIADEVKRIARHQRDTREAYAAHLADPSSACVLAWLRSSLRRLSTARSSARLADARTIRHGHWLHPLVHTGHTGPSWCEPSWSGYAGVLGVGGRVNISCGNETNPNRSVLRKCARGSPRILFGYVPCAWLRKERYRRIRRGRSSEAVWYLEIRQFRSSQSP